MLLYSIFTWLHTCRGSLCMLHVFPKLYLPFSISLSKALMYVVINYQKGGHWKHKCSWVILVINVNISLVGLILLPSMFQISSTMEWHGLEDVEPLQDAKDKGLAQASGSRLYIFYFSDPRSHWVYRKSQYYQGGMRCCLMACLLKVLSDMLQSPQPLSHIHICPKPKVKLGPTDSIYLVPPSFKCHSHCHKP